MCWVGGPACAKAWGWWVECSFGPSMPASGHQFNLCLETQAQRGAGRHSRGPQYVRNTSEHIVFSTPQSHSAPCWECPHLLPGSPPKSLGSSHSSLLAALANLGPASGPLHWLFLLPEMPFSCAWPTSTFGQGSTSVNPQESTLRPPDGGGSPATPGTGPTPFLGSIFPQPCSRVP